MTAFFRSWLVMASLGLCSSWGWAQAPQYAGPEPQFEGFAPGGGVQYNFGHAQPGGYPMPEHELIPTQSSLLDFDVLHDLAIRDVVSNSWVRAEYLHANFKRPGDDYLGAPISLVPNPREPFLVDAGDLIDARAIVPDLSPLDLDAQSGVRTTIGINAIKGLTIEASWVGLQDMTSGYLITPGGVDPTRFPEMFDPTVFPDSARFFATSVLDAGSVGSRVILYDRSFEVDMQAQYWSGDVNVLFNYHVPDTGFRLLPLIGFRFNSYDESLSQHGTFDNSSGVDAAIGVLTTPTRNTIRSSAQNKLCMGQFGFQAELVDKWFTLGFSPKFAMGSNSIQTSAFTSDLRDSAIDDTVDDVTSRNGKSNVIFGTNLDLNSYVKIHVNPWLSLTGGAYFWYMPNVARANQVLVYDDNGIDEPPAFRTKIKTSGMSVHGFTVGAEIKF